MDESAGPVESGAPAKLLDLLSPTTQVHALDWRQRCRAHSARTGRRLKAGDLIRFAEPLRFSDGSEGRTFRVKKERFAGANRTTTHRDRPGLPHQPRHGPRLDPHLSRARRA